MLCNSPEQTPDRPGSLQSNFSDTAETDERPRMLTDAHRSETRLRSQERSLNRDDREGEEDVTEAQTEKQDFDSESVREVPYSRFGRREKFMLVIICASSGLFSTIAAPIYYPALQTIEVEFHISTELVNISVVVYFLLQGLAPTLMGGLADTFGRRPVVLWSVALYVAACIGLARAKTYGEILFLRCLQSAGISPVIAVNSGIMGDVTTKVERGGYVGLTSGFQILGNAFGALIGAGILATWNWRAIFWFLAIGAGVNLIFAGVMLPETKRTIVGNGSIRPPQIFSKSPFIMFPSMRRKLHLDYPDLETRAPPQKLDLLAPLVVFRRPEVALLLLVTGLQFSLWTCQLTALSSLLERDYHLSIAKVGLSYLPSGICTLISVVSAGRILNWNYRRRMRIHEQWINTVREQLLKENDDSSAAVEHILATNPKYLFNIFRARLEIIFAPLILSGAGFISFGWCLDVHAPLPAVLVMSGFASLFSNCIISCATTLVIDLFPQRSSTATACVNFSRCILAAIFVACLDKMFKSMSVGGTFTFLASLCLASTFILWIPIKYGMQWEYRRSQRKKQDETNTTQDSDLDSDLECQQSHNTRTLPSPSTSNQDRDTLRRISTVSASMIT
ncbi:LAMI_0C08262g1_1 [Lachancea mirantina]|uniref:LAMI_0C08262g1_1 n=1 Tax=Lachancea mirantina TaxID=1230905 RepID=A0A1G4J4M9_9SACH|nr:LAMI_0C08262g1_1 [Lachancea mirantina]